MTGLRSIDLALASRFGDGQPAAAAAIALASWAAGQGHAGLPLSELAEGKFDELLAESARQPLPVADILQAIQNHPNIGPPCSGRPFVLDLGMLYLRRIWRLENEAAALLESLAERRVDADDAVIRVALDRWLPDATDNAESRQTLIHAARNALTLLTGGPGTGKTWTAARLLGFLADIEQAPLRLAAAAPTGKAAARLTASLRELSADISSNLPMPEAATIHRLLGVRPHSNHPRHDENSPLPVDVLLVDEASMIDLPMLVKLLRALPDSARLILLGDPDQLPALGGGRVLADLLSVQSADPGAPAASQTAAVSRIAHRLGRVRRFSEDSPQAALLRCVRTGEPEHALAAIDAGAPELLAEWGDSQPDSGDWLERWRIEFHSLRQGTLAERLAALLRFRVLCAGYGGWRGVDRVNAAAERAILGHPAGGREGRNEHYDGQPILILQNASQLDLWNGDLGLIASDGGGPLRAWFADAGRAPRSVRLELLPEHGTAYAMTVHKAQGSEFNDVVLMLPSTDSPLLSREWLYTGASRARRSLTVVGERDALRRAVQQTQLRYSRLAERLTHS